MARSVDTKILGLAELQKMLDTLPVKIERNIVRGALRVGAKEFERIAKEQAPEAPPNSENQAAYGGYQGALRDSIRTSVRLKKGVPVATVKAGGKTKKGADVYYAHFVEFGTAPHPIRARKTGAMQIGDRFSDVVMHPGSAPRPFMRPALDNGTAQAISAFAAYVRKRLTKEGLSVPDPLGTLDGPDDSA